MYMSLQTWPNLCDWTSNKYRSLECPSTSLVSVPFSVVIGDSPSSSRASSSKSGGGSVAASSGSFIRTILI